MKDSLASSEMWEGGVQLAPVGASNVSSAQTENGDWRIFGRNVGGEGVILNEEVPIGAMMSADEKLAKIFLNTNVCAKDLGFNVFVGPCRHTWRPKTLVEPPILFAKVAFSKCPLHRLVQVLPVCMRFLISLCVKQYSNSPSRYRVGCRLLFFPLLSPRPPVSVFDFVARAHMSIVICSVCASVRVVGVLMSVSCVT